MKPLVGILMGSDSDLPVMEATGKILKEFGVEYEITVCSAHRTPDRAREYAVNARERGLKVIIAGAGGAAHLAGVLAASTILPVIGVPIHSKLDGLDSLLSTLQMPSGIPVATVAIDGAKNAGILAVEILATSDDGLAEKLADYKKKMAEEVNEKARKVEKNN
ncbi:MAG: 5-(carboxyamino)imidazole ribonucleotide mutase [Patescibacteria group bacterium]|jgi:5-(carboxyamino)imidazole ribonucleotide mutase